MSWASYRRSGGSSGFRARGSFKGARVSGGTYETGDGGASADRRTVIIGVARDPVTGKVITENVGKRLSEEQRQKVADLMGV